MTTDISNSGIGITQFAATQTSSTHLLDKTDSPHSGLFKALHRSMQGNYVIRDASNHGVDIRITLVTGQFKVAVHTAGKGFFNGKLVPIATLSATNITQPSSGAFYHWVRYNSSGTCSVLEGTADAVVPDIGVGFAPIALIKLQHDTTATSDVAIQYFTTSQETNSLSLGYGNSNAYTEMSSITAASGGTTIEVGTAGGDFIIDNTDADKKIVMRLGTDTSATAFEVRNNSDAVKFAVGGDGSFTGLPVTGVANGVDNRIATFSSASALNGEANLTFDGNLLTLGTAATTTDVLEINADSVTDGYIVDIHADGLEGGRAINIHSNSSNNSSRRLVNIHNDHASATGVIPLYIRNDSTGDFIILESTDASATSMPIIAFNRNSDSPAANDFLGSIEFKGEDSANASNTYANIKSKIIDVDDGQESGAIILESLHDGTLRSVLFAQGGIDTGGGTGAGSIVLNEEGQNIDTRIESDDEEFMFFVDASNNRVSIGDSEDAPAATLEITNHATAGATGVPLLQLNSNDTDQYAVDINAANITEDVMIITADALTTAHVVNISADALTTGTMFLLHSNSADTSTRDLFHIHNDHASATGTTALDVENDSTGPVAKFEGNGALLANIGPPITTANTTSTGSGLNSRVTTVVVGNATYAPTVSDSGTLILFNHSGANVTLPSINNSTSVGVQFTVYNQTTSDITGQIAVSNSATINGDAATSHDDISSDKAATFVCNGDNTWIRIG